MYNPDLRDDVLELCRSVHLDPAAYKRFESPVRAPSGPQASPKLPEVGHSPCDDLTLTLKSPSAAAGASGSDRAAPAEPVHPRPISRPAPVIGADGSAIATYQDALLQAIAAINLSNAGCAATPVGATERDLSTLATVHKPLTRPPWILPLLSGVGGCGVTTVLASFGRALCILGQRVLLVDAAGPSTLDCFYESRGTHSGLLLSTDPVYPFEGQAHVLRTDGDAAGASQSCSTRFRRAAAELRDGLDSVLIGGTHTLTPELARQAWISGTCLVVITPELRSLLHLPAILRNVNTQATTAGASVSPWFLLNKFNNADAAHVAIRKSLASQLGSRLLPFAIPETDAVREALTQGASVLDIAPQSAYAESCFDLAEWYLSTYSRCQSQPNHIEETQLVSK
jgi:cellulose biosynthesis protein BcsQ